MEEISFNWEKLGRLEEEVAVILDLKRHGGLGQLAIWKVDTASQWEVVWERT